MPYEQPQLEETASQSFGPGDWWRKTPIWIKAVAAPLCLGFAGMSLLLFALRTAPLPEQDLSTPTEIESADGQSLAVWSLHASRGQQTLLADIPKSLQEATIAVEDAKFYQHHAFDLPAIGRAFLTDVAHGKIVEGGSTITQQLAKNLFLNQDRTLSRKLKEALYAMQLELHESKQSILEQYLNVVYYGHGAYGIGAAADLYFHKPVSQLNLAESAMLAGLPNGPGIYSPLTNFRAAKARQRVVLQRMVACGFITQQQADEAYHTPLHLSGLRSPSIRAPYFTSTAISEVEHRYHLTSEDLYQGDMTVVSTLDSVLQEAAERAVASTLPKDSKLQAALVALDPDTGAVKAIVGGRDFTTSSYNRAFAERQPGSTFKAILYTTALEHGWQPSREVQSEMTTFLYDKDKEYTVHDYGDFYAHRALTLREALARSDNVYAVTTNLEIGPEEVEKTAHAMGISSPLQPYPSLALGVFETSPLQMATVYATLANGGYRVEPYTVSEIRDAHQNQVRQANPSRTRVVTPQAAFQMSDLLQSVLQPNGTAYFVRHYLRGPAAVKTGTTDADAWTVGYTPRIVCAVWVGYDDGRPLTVAESHLAAPIWAKFMGMAQQHLPSPWYTPPAGLVKVTIDPATAEVATPACRITETDYFLPGTEPTKPCHLHAVPEDTPPVQKWPQWLRRWL
ncbi:PBP1A family penicillin-binding protein [Alicyclobacillus cycloheptanicus]|uniref:1A family penicillin-binding protein n=1 Tax=Alicyclobacillus cycloheptanicus TaxID=1457 RepID=A0ABT9XMN6_9BACL|nr:PBP1A family penicillin-binding protein [Alicyclobacillus cycloheptanicus]MDQ0191557.1 1A family penicillin-binding protein [Alicyclobacillus cycloheptanicus]WDM02347.1 PBP1A family penicillin-binding protein [Alicyclobacillus cycloheptanicus]